MRSGHWPEWNEQAERRVWGHSVAATRSKRSIHSFSFDRVMCDYKLLSCLLQPSSVFTVMLQNCLEKLESSAAPAEESFLLVRTCKGLIWQKEGKTSKRTIFERSKLLRMPSFILCVLSICKIPQQSYYLCMYELYILYIHLIFNQQNYAFTLLKTGSYITSTEQFSMVFMSSEGPSNFM